MEMVHLKMYVPRMRPVTVVTGDDGVVITARLGPMVWVQVPVPVPGVFPAIVVLVWLPQNDWFGPALAVVGRGWLTMVTWSVLGVHGAFAIVH